MPVKLLHLIVAPKQLGFLLASTSEMAVDVNFCNGREIFHLF